MQRGAVATTALLWYESTVNSSAAAVQHLAHDTLAVAQH